MPSFNAIKKVHTRNCSPKQKSKLIKQGGKLDYSRYSQVYVIIGTLLALEMAIAK